jgi:hypothetical protein
MENDIWKIWLWFLCEEFAGSMRRTKLAAFLVLLCASTATAQSQCPLKLSQLPDAPELFGFRIGMTKDRVKTRVPQVVFSRKKTFGLAKTSINPDFDPRINKSTFAGVRTISLDLLDDKLTSLWLGYDSSFKWQTVPEFVDGISRSLHLPQAWSPWKSGGQQLRCADFQMTVSIVAEGPSFRIIDKTSEKIWNARRQAGEQDAEKNYETVVADKQTKLYYPKGCQPPKEIKDSDRVNFKNAEVAEAAGYFEARQCRE